MESWREEIERAIDNIKRTKWDKQFRRAWYRAGGRLQKAWSRNRKAQAGWRQRLTHPELNHPRAIESKVWVRGHVPPESLDWVDRHRSQNSETRAMLSECCFEVWDR